MGSHRGTRRGNRQYLTGANSTNPLTDVWIYSGVFLGGSCGSAARFALSRSLNGQPRILGIHWGTFSANLLATFLYAFIAALLVLISSSRGKELTSRALGMGFCGGLSTMSTLALEIVGSSFGWLYAIISVMSGLLCAVLGSLLGSVIVGTLEKKRNESRSQATGRSHARKRRH